MKRFAVFLMPLILVGQAPRRQAPAPQRPPTAAEDLCTVEGQVLNAATGEPLGKAKLTLRRSESGADQGGLPRAYSASTDAGGKFVVVAVEPGKYRLSAMRTGFVDTEYGARDYMQSGSVLSLDPKQRMSNLVFRMTPHGVIAGRIVDEDGDPLMSAQVQAMRARYSQGRKQLVSYGSDSTNDLGEYRIYGLPPGRYYLSVSARRGSMPERGVRATSAEPEAEYVPMFYPGATETAAASPIDMSPGGQLHGLDMTLSRRHTVRVKGRVVDASGTTTGAAVPGGPRMMVSLMPRDSAAFGAFGRPSMLDVNGNFEIGGIAPGSYTLIATIPTRGPPLNARLPIEVANVNLENLSLTIRPPVSIAGRVRVDGTAEVKLSNIQVSLRPTDAGGMRFGGPASGRVREDGALNLTNINPDRYFVMLSSLPDGFYVKSIRAGDQEALTAGVDLSSGAPGALDIVLRPNAGQASGLVRNDQQQPAAGATVVLVPQEPDRRIQSQYYKTATTDETGHFTLGNLPPGEYKLYAWQEIEPGAYMDPEFLKPVENRGESLTIREGSQESAQLRLIG